MKLAINQATMMKTPMEVFLRSIAKAGFTGVELRRDETFEYLKSHSVDELKRLLEETGLKVVSWNAIELFSLCTESAFLDMYEYTERLMQIGNQIGCELIIAVPSFKKDSVFPLAEIDKITVERLRILRQLGEKYNFTVGFEPLGFPDCSVRNITHAIKILKETEEDGLSSSPLVIDTFHYFLGEHTIEELGKIEGDRLGLIHLNDSIDKSLSQLQDKDRIWPGNGIFDLTGFHNELKKQKYDGYISLELFNEDYWKLDPYECAQKAFEYSKKYII